MKLTMDDCVIALTGRDETVSLDRTIHKLTPRFDSIARCIERLESKLPFSLESLQRDFDLQDIASMNVYRIIQLSVDVCTMIIARSPAAIPGDMAECLSVVAGLGWISQETSLRMKKSVGLRNIMVHEYEKIDWEIVHGVVHDHLSDVKVFIREIIEHLAHA